MPQFVSTQIGKGTVLQAPTADGTVGQFLQTDGAGNLSFATVAASPSGSDTQIQFNDGGSFGGSANLTWDDATFQVIGTSTTAPTLIAKLPASATANAFEVQDSTGAVRGYLDVSPGNPKFMMLDFYGDEIAIEGTARSVKISHKNAIMATASSYGGSGGITKTFYFDNIVFKNGINGLADRQQYVACGIRNVVDSVPTATGYSNRHTNVTVQRDDTLLMCTPSMTALNNERNDSGHLMLATGNASIAGTATEANGGSVYIALGAKAGSGSDGKFIVRTLAGVDHFWVDLDNNAVVTGSDGSSATGGTMRSGHGVGTDIAGANLTIAAGEGTGTGAGGHLIFQTAAASTSGSSLNTLATALEIDDNQTVSVTSSSTTDPCLTVRMPASHAANAWEVQDSTATVHARVTSDGDFSRRTGAYIESESFGDSATVTGSYSTSIGSQATAAATSIAVGRNCSVAGLQSQSLGNDSTTSGFYSTTLGSYCTNNHNSSTTIGRGAASTAANQLVIGAAGTTGTGVGVINDVAFGASTSATPQAVMLRNCNGSGTNISAANMTIAAGRGTGTGAGGHLIFQTASASTSGSSLNTLATMLELTDDSKIGFFAATPVVQQAGTGETTGFTAGSGTAVNDDSTFTGNVGTAAYTISDIVKALKNYGLLTSS